MGLSFFNNTRPVLAIIFADAGCGIWNTVGAVVSMCVSVCAFFSVGALTTTVLHFVPPVVLYGG